MTEVNGNEIVLLDGPDAVAEALASRLTARLVELQGERSPQVALTGGRIATKAYQRLAADGAAPGGSGVDWSQVELWWGDERFVAADDDDRNDRDTLAQLMPLGFEPGRVHTMPSSDSGADLDAAAAAYGTELGDTVFDICLLGMGPDGHVASLFPDHPSSSTPGEVIAVRNSPKPPPDRLSLTLDVINRSREVWFLVSGADKADAAAKAILRTVDLPAARVTAADRTIWLLDRDAAAALPPGLV